MNESTTNRVLLSSAAYVNDRPLSSRQRLYDFQEPSYDLPGLVLGYLGDRRRNVVLDVGCGNGRYTERMRGALPDAEVIGTDISAGILAPIASPVAVADAEHLPFADGSADVVLAMHMIYHLEDIDAGLAEFARVLAHGGILFASTNAISDKSELDDLWRAAAGVVLETESPPERISLSRRFPLDQASAILGTRFTTVAIHELPGVIRVTAPEPIIDHLASYEAFAHEAGIPFQETISAAEDLLSKHLEANGEFTITCLGGILECTLNGTA